jgi:hypothetical protein
MAIASPNIQVSIIEATEFPDLVRHYHVSGVPKAIVNDRIEILGALPESMFVPQVVEAARDA